MGCSSQEKRLKKKSWNLEKSIAPNQRRQTLGATTKKKESSCSPYKIFACKYIWSMSELAKICEITIYNYQKYGKNKYFCCNYFTPIKD